MSTVSNSVNSVNSANSVNSVKSVNSVNNVNSCSAVLPPSPMVFYYVYIVVEVTMKMAIIWQSAVQQPENVNFEPIKRGLKSDIFD